VYSRKDVENLIRVRELLYRDGFTIAGAKKKLQRPHDEPDVAAEQDAEPEAEAPAPVAVQTIAAPAAPVTAPSAVPRTREKLLALRAEVEAFLEELSPRPR
jgi:DNA-binding transcriptional MerR regulator